MIKDSSKEKYFQGKVTKKEIKWCKDLYKRLNNDFGMYGKEYKQLNNLLKELEKYPDRYKVPNNKNFLKELDV